MSAADAFAGVDQSIADFQKAIDAAFGPWLNPKPKPRPAYMATVPITALGADWIASVEFYAERMEADEFGPACWEIDVDSVTIAPNETGVTWSRAVEISFSELDLDTQEAISDACQRVML